jgi:DNA integrity scanning protein DisA with diadenylate cyclase activity
LFPESSSADHQKIWDLFTILAQQDHGSMIVVASDAVEEARRLAQQGSIVQPVSMTEELLRSVSKIDGTIILDPHSVCHAVGVILDGPANDECTPSRGSRYNSGIRYVQGSDKSRLAIVVSDDRTVDLIPLLRERIDSTQIERSIEALERATLDNYHQARNFLDDHRFYLNEEQCKRTNAALDRIENLPKEVGELVMLTSRFKPHPEMNDSYYN